MNKLLLGLVLMLSYGCVGMGNLAGVQVKAYEGPEKPAAELALLLGGPLEVQGLGYVTLAEVDHKVYGDELRGYPDQVLVTPGQHQLKIKCMLGMDYGFLLLDVNLKANRKYRLSCQRALGSTATAQIEEIKAADQS